MAFIDLRAELVALYPSPSSPPSAEDVIDASFYVQPLYDYILSFLQTNSKSNELGQFMNTIREQNAENIYVKIHLANKGNSKIHRVKCLLDFFLGLFAEYLRDQKLTLAQLKSIHAFVVSKTQQPEGSPRTTTSTSPSLDSEDAVIESCCDLLKDHFADVATSKKTAKKTQSRRGSKTKGSGEHQHDSSDATSPYSSDASPFPASAASSSTTDESPKKKQKVTHSSVTPKVEEVKASPVTVAKVKQEPRPEATSPSAPASVSSAPSGVNDSEIELLEKVDNLLTEKASLQEQVHSLQNKLNLLQSQLQQEQESSHLLQERVRVKDKLIQSLKKQDQTSAQKKVELFEVFCQTMKSFISKQPYAADFQGPFHELENKLKSL